MLFVKVGDFITCKGFHTGIPSIRGFEKGLATNSTQNSAKLDPQHCVLLLIKGAWEKGYRRNFSPPPRERAKVRKSCAKSVENARKWHFFPGGGKGGNAILWTNEYLIVSESLSRTHNILERSQAISSGRSGIEYTDPRRPDLQTNKITNLGLGAGAYDEQTRFKV